MLQGALEKKEPPNGSSTMEIPPFISGSFGGFFSAIASYPLDTLKVRAQSGRTFTGSRAFFSGLMTPISVVTPSWALIYWGYSRGREWGGAGPFGSALGGFTAAFSCSVCRVPMENVKCTAQVNKTTSRQALQSVWQAGGLGPRGLYRGYIPTLMYEVPGFTAFFVVYDEIKERQFPEQCQGFLGSLAAALVASFMESLAGMPGDTLRVRYQTDRRWSSVKACATDLWNKQVSRDSTAASRTGYHLVLFTMALHWGRSIC